MQDIVCFTMPDGERFCIRIPILADPHWKFPPDPRIGRQFEDLQVLATIGELAKGLKGSREVTRELHASVQSAMKNVVATMPDGTTLHSAQAPVAA